MMITGYLFDGPPEIVGEILRAVAFPGTCGHNSAPPHHYADRIDLRVGDLIPDERQAELWRLVARPDAEWLEEAIRDGGAVAFEAWEVGVEVLVWWDGDGTIVFYLDAADGRRRILTNDDSKKVNRWKEVAV